MYSNETIANFLTLRSQGLSYDKIAKELKVSKHTLLGWAKQFRPPIDARLQAALETYHATILHRAETLAQQFQTITQALSACDATSSRYPRLASLLLKFHKALQEFDFNPGALSENCTKTAPTHDSEPARTKTAPESVSLPSIQNPKSKIQNETSPTEHLARTKTAPNHDSEPDSTKSAPPLKNPHQELRRLNAIINSTAKPILASLSSIQNPKSKIQNLPPGLKRIQDKIDRLEAKIAS